MIPVEIESVRMSLISQNRLVVLKDTTRDRFLPIWIGPFEADAITIELQGVQVARPLTHDLLRSVIAHAGLKVQHIVVNDLRNETFFATIVWSRTAAGPWRSTPGQATPSPWRSVSPHRSSWPNRSWTTRRRARGGLDLSELSEDEEDRLSVFSEFLDSLDVDDLEDDNETQ